MKSKKEKGIEQIVRYRFSDFPDLKYASFLREHYMLYVGRTTCYRSKDQDEAEGTSG